MGISASQARLLSITARLTSNEYESQQISNAKMRLATKSEQASNEYIAALNTRQLQFVTYDAQGAAVVENLTANATDVNASAVIDNKTVNDANNTNANSNAVDSGDVLKKQTFTVSENETGQHEGMEPGTYVLYYTENDGPIKIEKVG